MTVTLTNPRTVAVIADYPLGGSKRGQCVFKVEHNEKKGYRVGRTTTGATKYHTYGGLAAICDGSDGKTYVLQVAHHSRAVAASRHDFKNADIFTNRHGHTTNCIFPDDPGYDALYSLITQAYPKPAAV